MTDDESELTKRVEQLEKKVFPNRRDVLKGAAGAAIGGAAVFGATSNAAAGSQSAGAWGTQNKPQDGYVEDLYDHNGNNILTASGDGSVGIVKETLTGNVVRAWGVGGTYSDYSIGDYADIGGAINQAISDGAALIETPAGTHSFSTDITSSGPVGIVGQGRDPNAGTELDYTGTGTAFSSTSTSGSFTFADVYLSGPGSTSGTTGIDVDTRLVMPRVQIGAFGTGVSLTNANYTQVSSSTIANCDVGVAGNGNSVRFFGVDVRGHATAGYDLENFNVWAIRGGSIENNPRGIDARTSGSDPRGLTVEGVYIEGNTTQSIVATDASGAGTMKGTTVRDCYFNTTGGPADAVRVDNCVEAELSHNIVVGSATDAYDIRGGATDTVLKEVKKVDLPINDSGVRTRYYETIAGGPLGGTDIGSLTGADTGDKAMANGTTATNADTLWVLKSTGDWQRVDGGATITPA